MAKIAPTFAAQRIIFLAMVLGITLYAIVAGAVLASNDGRGLADLDDDFVGLAWWIGGAAAFGALSLRWLLLRGLDGLAPAALAMRLFVARMLPLAMLEGGALFALTLWLLSGKNVPPLAVAMVLLSIAIAIVPFREVDDDA